ncbi:class I SAM-dependent DNA methyltransferase [Auritidibacter ignavus]|uniref:Class I SAM-dependent methyltransferase n=1 Tax=Auritidibacter ignavus TaxID=678932 RepID=A0AAJ6DD33_9MICC|nr:class I SAM-dependent methyltransferase [Auritidibacter ignavus]PXA76624.1 hypothetical protein DCC26_09170 [Auritidibacter sp. NML120779]WGH84867.1 class I SAM-dependent methyltransferase [Auritidibacter ignavus]WGH94305.1 class I SAM-dependent methyltransferase [Auritidibacter ignavus]WHS27382.1 class I SAM-dependent methyltransferase [Auritidibacter ignavus]
MIDHVISNGQLTASFYDEVTAPDSFPDEAAEWLLSTIGPERTSILDLGVGTGRVLSRIARSLQRDKVLTRYRLHGVDISPEMIAQARSKPELAGVTFTIDDVRSVCLSEQYSAVICLGNTLGMSLEDNALTEIFKTAARHLDSAGLFIVDFQNPVALDSLFTEASVVSSFEQNDSNEASGIVQFFSRPTERLFRINQHWIVKDEVTSFVEEISLYPAEQVREVAESCGFNLVDAYGDYLGSPLIGTASFMNVLVFRYEPSTI